MDELNTYSSFEVFKKAWRESHTIEERWEQSFRDAKLRYRKTSVAHASARYTYSMMKERLLCGPIQAANFTVMVAGTNPH